MPLIKKNDSNPREVNWDNARWVIKSLVKKIYLTGPYRALGWEKEDIEQECLLYIIQRVNDYDPTKAAFTTWVYNSSNWALLHMRDESNNFIRLPKGTARKKEKRDEIIAKQVKLDGWDKESKQWSGTSEIKDYRTEEPFRDTIKLQEAFDKLEPVTREMIEMAYGIDRDMKVPLEDIAKEYNLALNKVKTKIKNGLEIIKRNVDYNGLRETSGSSLSSGKEGIQEK